MICKLFEMSNKDHIFLDLLVKHTLSNSSQREFKERSSSTNMLLFLQEISECIYEGSPVDMFYLSIQISFRK